MLANVKDQLHSIARLEAKNLIDPDKKQLRFNEIVETAMRFYPHDSEAGVRELVRACDRINTSLYVAKAPMWEVLNSNYGWML